MRKTLWIGLFTGFVLAQGSGSLAGPENNAAALGRTLSVQSVTLSIDGTSTMHDYTLSTKTVTMNATTALADIESLMQPGAIQTLELQIPVNGFSSEQPGVKTEMLKALQADKHPDIAFRLNKYAIEPLAGGGITVASAGTLSVAGVEQPIELVLDVKESASGLQVRGSHDLSMKDFGITPPTVLMGTLRTNEKVTVTFDLQLAIARSVLVRR